LKLEGYAREVQAAKDQAIRFVREAGGIVQDAEIPSAFWDAAHDWSTPADDEVMLRAIVPLAASPLLMAAVPPDARLLAQPASWAGSRWSSDAGRRLARLQGAAPAGRRTVAGRRRRHGPRQGLHSLRALPAQVPDVSQPASRRRQPARADVADQGGDARVGRV